MNHVEQFLNLKYIIDYNSLMAPPGNLGVNRESMPQIDSKYRDEFIQWLRNKGVKVKRTRVPLKDLRMCQGEYDRDKVMSIIDEMKKGGKGKFDPIFVSKDMMVIDGNHRLIAKLNLNDGTRFIDVDQIDINIKDLLSVIRVFPHVQYRSLSNKKV